MDPTPQQPHIGNSKMSFFIFKPFNFYQTKPNPRNKLSRELVSHTSVSRRREVQRRRTQYFEEKVHGGEWDEVEKYLSGYTKVDDNRQDNPKAVEILVNNLKVFSTFNEDLYKEITQLLRLTNFRENEQLSKYGDTKTARSVMLVELKKLIKTNPLFREKLVFPTLKSSRLRSLINQRNQGPYPLVVAAHPQEQNQFAVGLTDGSVKVIEPSESEGKWGSNPSDE